MTAVKERIIGAVTVMTDRDAEAFWNIILERFAPSWDSIEEVAPDEDESLVMKAYHDGDPEYSPSISQDDLMEELGLQQD